mgnify:CR=1 FL=1
MGQLITDKAMQSKPSAKDRWLTETAKRGAGRLVGRVTPTGERLFYFRYTRADGKRDTLLIGSYAERPRAGAYTVAAARAKALEWSGLLDTADGAGTTIPNRDLRGFLHEQESRARDARERAARAELAADAARRQAADEAQRRAVTLRQVFDQWRDTALTPRTRADGKRLGRKDGGQYVFEQFGRHVFPSLGDVAIANIRKPDVFAILDRLVADNKLRTANVILTDLKQLFRFAAEREIVMASPIETIKKERVGGTDAKRERSLSAAELTALPALVAAAGLTKRSELGIYLILATGARIGELMGAVKHGHRATVAELRERALKTDVKFGTVDLAARKWRLLDTKNQRDHTIHLSDFAAEKFAQLIALSGYEDWLFPDKSGTQPVSVKSFGKQLADRQRDRAAPMSHRSGASRALALPGGKWTAHDLRRTAATLMATLGTSNDVINECLNHKQSDRMTQTYVQDRRLSEQAVAFDKLGRRLSELFGGRKTNKVVAIGGRR